jgi:hypothetical protein
MDGIRLLDMKLEMIFKVITECAGAKYVLSKSINQRPGEKASLITTGRGGETRYEGEGFGIAQSCRTRSRKGPPRTGGTGTGIQVQVCASMCKWRMMMMVMMTTGRSYKYQLSRRGWDANTSTTRNNYTSISPTQNSSPLNNPNDPKNPNAKVEESQLLGQRIPCT